MADNRPDDETPGRPLRPTCWSVIRLLIGLKALQLVLAGISAVVLYVFSSLGSREMLWSQALLQVVSHCLVFLVVLAVARRHSQPIRSSLSLNQAPLWTYPVVVVMVLAAGPWFALVHELVFLRTPVTGFLGDGAIGWPQLVKAASAVLMAPVVEEALFRGYAFNAFRRRFPPAIAIIVAGTLFALWHFSPPNMMAWLIFIPFGLASSFCVYRTKSIYPTIAAHGTWNLLVVVELSPVLFLPTPARLLVTAIVIVGSGLLLSSRRLFTEEGVS